jgi:hypothetical protein
VNARAYKPDSGHTNVPFPETYASPLLVSTSSKRKPRLVLEGFSSAVLAFAWKEISGMKSRKQLVIKKMNRMHKSLTYTYMNYNKN